MRNIFAYTAPGDSPEYISVNEASDAPDGIDIIIRSKPLTCDDGERRAFTSAIFLTLEQADGLAVALQQRLKEIRLNNVARMERGSAE